MELAVNVRVQRTEIPNLSSIAYGVGEAPDGTPVRFYDDWTTIRDLQDKINRGQRPVISVPHEHAILRRRHWAA